MPLKCLIILSEDGRLRKSIPKVKTEVRGSKENVPPENVASVSVTDEYAELLIFSNLEYLSILSVDQIIVVLERSGRIIGTRLAPYDKAVGMTVLVVFVDPDPTGERKEVKKGTDFDELMLPHFNRM